MNIRDSFLVFTSCIIALSLVYAAILQVSKFQMIELESAAVAVFTNSENVSIEIRSLSDKENVLFTGIGYVDLPVDATTSASGVRYVNNEAAIEVWNKGSELTVYKAGDPVFVGVSGTISKVDSNSMNYKPVVFSEALTNYTWEWLQPGLDQTTAESFTLKHENSGSVIVTTDCNNYTGTYTITVDKKINYSLEQSTLRECTDMSNEKLFIASIEQIKAAHILESMELQLLDTEDKPNMLFKIQLIPML